MYVTFLVSATCYVANTPVFTGSPPSQQVALKGDGSSLVPPSRLLLHLVLSKRSHVAWRLDSFKALIRWVLLQRVSFEGVGLYTCVLTSGSENCWGGESAELNRRCHVCSCLFKSTGVLFACGMRCLPLLVSELALRQRQPLWTYSAYRLDGDKRQRPGMAK